MTGRDWLGMTPEDFDATLAPDPAQEPALFDLPVDLTKLAPPEDGYGTGDLLAALEEQRVRERRERRLLGPSAEQLRDEQVARETVRARRDCPHCHPENQS